MNHKNVKYLKSGISIVIHCEDCQQSWTSKTLNTPQCVKPKSNPDTYQLVRKFMENKAYMSGTKEEIKEVIKQYKLNPKLFLISSYNENRKIVSLINLP